MYMCVYIYIYEIMIILINVCMYSTIRIIASIVVTRTVGPFPSVEVHGLNCMFH